jgi:hypothetical protein
MGRFVSLLALTAALASGTGYAGDWTGDEMLLRGLDHRPGLRALEPADEVPTAGARREPAPRDRPSCRDWSNADGNPYRLADCEDQPSEPAPGTPGITVADLERFLPGGDEIVTEPAAFGIRGLPVNFIADRGIRTVDGELLGQPVQVQFLPVSFAWDYGDGATAATEHPGATWERLRVAEFDETPTSHTYADRGTVTVRVSATVVARYRTAGGPWIPVPGTATLPSAERDLRIVAISTVLVSDDCLADPEGPGCE